MMAKEDFKRLLDERENNDLDFKLELSKPEKVAQLVSHLRLN